ncbi:Gfo/Idh/MocA family protein [Streptacidiphilus sp. EB129]|uniref:Gfo/Idh/MocA family protein n=1 Tax=Streptacidiphilus sp. EB129 TaxID=3156262 RepID=UPI0035151FD3
MTATTPASATSATTPASATSATTPASATSATTTASAPKAPLRIGVLGCSAIAWRRAIPAVIGCRRTELTAVASRDPDKARRFAGQFDCAAAAGYRELLARDDVDAVYLPLPASLHVPWGLEVLRAGKHLLVEKPAAETAAGARELARAAAEGGLVLRENFTFLHHSQHRAVQDLLAAARIGELRSLSAAFCFPPLPADDIRYRADLGGGALFDAGVYPLRAAQLLLGDGLTVTGATLRIDTDRGVDIAGQALLRSADGVLVDIAFGFEHAYGSWYSLWGSTGRLHLDRAFTPPETWAPRLRIDEQNRGEELTLPPDHQFHNSVDSFAEAVLAGRGAADPGEAARCEQTAQTLELVQEIQRLAVRVDVTSGK